MERRSRQPLPGPTPRQTRIEERKQAGPDPATFHPIIITQTNIFTKVTNN